MAEIALWRNALAMALVNPLTIYAALSLVKSCLPDSAFRIAFTNGLMSESMLLWFGALLLWTRRGRIQEA